MQLPTLVVRINAAVFFAYGLAFIIMPELLSISVTGSAPDNSSALIDMRATYGGMSLAVGLVLFLLTTERRNTKLGLLAVMLLMLGMAGGRLYGMLVDGDANMMMYIYLGLEVAMAAIACWLWRRHATDRLFSS